MNSVVGNAGKGLPSLIGVLWGISLYRPDLLSLFVWLQPVAVIVVAILFLLLGRKVIGHLPLLGWVFLEFWILASISVMAVTTVIILLITIKAQSFFPFGEEERKAISGALVGAITTYLAILWTKDIQDASGFFWPSTQFKNALSSAFNSHPLKPNTPEMDAVYEERVHASGGPIGWGLRERFKRARILQEYLKRRRLREGEVT
jgi:hypothetical protein